MCKMQQMLEQDKIKKCNNQSHKSKHCKQNLKNVKDIKPCNEM